MKSRKLKRRVEGQSIVEFSLVLPLLLLMFIGMIEVGSIFYDYLILAVANREGVRFSSRGRFDPPDVAERVIAAGGGQEVEDPHPHFEPHLKTTGLDANFGMIVTSFPIDEDGNLEEDDDGQILITTYVTGTVAAEDGTMRPIAEDDSRIDKGELPTFHGEISKRVNELREDADFDPQRTEIVVVETFLAHNVLLPGVEIINFPDPMTVYFASSMRVLRDRSSTAN
jgi:hypothetical protein